MWLAYRMYSNFCAMTFRKYIYIFCLNSLFTVESVMPWTVFALYSNEFHPICLCILNWHFGLFYLPYHQDTSFICTFSLNFVIDCQHLSHLILFNIHANRLTSTRFSWIVYEVNRSDAWCECYFSYRNMATLIIKKYAFITSAFYYRSLNWDNIHPIVECHHEAYFFLDCL